MPTKSNGRGTKGTSNYALGEPSNPYFYGISLWRSDLLWKAAHVFKLTSCPKYPSQQKPFSNPWRLLVLNVFRNKGSVVFTMNNLCISACDDCIERSKSLTSHSVFKLLCSVPLPYWTSSKDVFAMQCSQCKAKDVVAAKKNIGQNWLKECNRHTVGRTVS